ncbi:MAG TPA: outer membrane porin, OprD family, partial [Pseudomonas sp.]|nr:outer membrane porin, OprD family [Pseudomonas sp.]
MMQKISISRLTLAGGMTSMITQSFAADGGFVEDATATLQVRNYYFSRDFSDIVGPNQQSKAEEWGQGFILNFRSGYTPGTVGFGADAIGQLG